MPGAVTIHRGQQNLAGAIFFHDARARRRRRRGRCAFRPPWVKISKRSGRHRLRRRWRRRRTASRISALPRARIGGRRHGSGVDGGLVRAPASRQGLRISPDRAYPAADGERHETGFCRTCSRLCPGACLRALVNWQKYPENTAHRRLARRKRRSRCATGSPASRSPTKVDTLDDAPVLHVEAGDEAGFKHRAGSAPPQSAPKPPPDRAARRRARGRRSLRRAWREPAP